MSAELLLTLLAVFATVAVITGALASLILTRTAPGRRRLRADASDRECVARRPDLPRPTQLVQRVASLTPRSPKDMTRLRRRFTAGYQTMTPDRGVHRADRSIR